MKDRLSAIATKWLAAATAANGWNPPILWKN
jgi:hypothetical protein